MAQNLEIVRAIFEGGIEVSGRQHALQLEAPTFRSVVAEVRQRYGVRPIVVVYRHCRGESEQLLHMEDGHHMGLDLNNIQSPAPHLFRLSLPLMYTAGAVVHHCTQLAVAYSNICASYFELKQLPESAPTSVLEVHGTYTSSETAAAWYELDALLTAARRTYDATRFLLWQAFGSGDSVPRNFIRAVRACTKLPPHLRAELQRSWTTNCEKLTDYRDCLMHYAPLNPGMAEARMTRVDGRTWTMSALLPDNPETKSAERFTFARRLDALAYGWSVAAETVRIAGRIVEEATAALAARSNQAATSSD